MKETSRKLKGLIITNGDTQAQLAESMKLSRQRLNAKLNETDNAFFTQDEINFIKDRYKLSDSHIHDLFLRK